MRAASTHGPLSAHLEKRRTLKAQWPTWKGFDGYRSRQHLLPPAACICWAIWASDRGAFAQAAKFSHTMWGGRFNPIAIVDRPEEAERIVEVFRADMIVPVGAGDALDAFKKRFPHLISPFFPDGLFVIARTRFSCVCPRYSERSRRAGS